MSTLKFDKYGNYYVDSQQPSDEEAVSPCCARDT